MDAEVIAGEPTLRERLYYRMFGADAILSGLLRPESRVLDVGCSDGRGSVALAGAWGCDIYEPSLAKAARVARRRRVVRTDVRQLPYRSSTFDVVVALDVIEHFEKPDALAVMAEMARVSRGVVVVMTPSGFLAQPGTPEEPWQEHRCGFAANELRDLGFDVTGVGGVAGLRGDYGAFRWGVAGQLLAVASRPVVRSRPSWGFHLIGVKRMGA